MSDRPGLQVHRTPLVVEQLESPVFRLLLDWWRLKRGSRAMPARQDVRPEELRFALGRLSLIDVVRPPVRFRLRLVGSETVNNLGFDPTGCWVDEIEPAAYARAVRLSYLGALARRVPCANRYALETPEHRTGYLQMLLPFSSDGEQVDLLMSAAVADANWRHAFRAQLHEHVDATPRPVGLRYV